MKFEIDTNKIEQTLKILDVMHYIIVDYINKIDYRKILNYHRARYMFKEVVDEFEEINLLLRKKQTLMATALLRNAYEEILYVIAVSDDPTLEANVNTKAGYFKDYVKDKCQDLFKDTITAEDIQDTYQYLSKLVHVTNLKELASYLASDKPCAVIMAKQMQVSLIVVEFTYLFYLYEKLDLNDELPKKLLLLIPFLEILNILRMVNETEGKQLVLEDYIRNDKNREYLKEKSEKAIPEIQSTIELYKEQFADIISDIDMLIKEQGYEPKMNEMLSKEV